MVSYYNKKNEIKYNKTLHKKVSKRHLVSTANGELDTTRCFHVLVDIISSL